MAKTDVIMPQMGESIAEGTVVKWLKKVGDAVKRDEPLFEISTDKVDAEIPSPSAGVLAEIKVAEGTTVAVNTVVGVIGDSAADIGGGDGKAPAKPAAASAVAAAAPAPAPAAPRPAAPAPVATHTATAVAHAGAHPTQAPAAAVAQYAAGAPVEFPSPRGVASKEDLRRTRSTPLVRRMAADNGVDISRLTGTGISGRVTKNDLQAALDGGLAATSAAAPAAYAPAPSAPAPGGARTAYHVAAYAPGDNVRLEPMSVMRKKIADHMVYSKHTSPHVHTLYEIDCTNMLDTRQKVQAEFVQRYGQKLTITPFIVKAAVMSLRHVPIVNASVDGDTVVYKNDINVGVAVALDWGLIVPVVKRADELTLAGINNRVADLANRARNKQLLPDEVAGGTFTITNPGVFGAMVGLPIISQPQVAILGVGKIEKRVKVLEGDVIAIRSCMYVSLGYDHRVVDGATADAFLSHLKLTLETGDFKAML